MKDKIGIAIDLDGTLIDSFLPLFHAYAKFLLLQGKEATVEEFKSLNGYPIFDMILILKEKHKLYLPIEKLEKIFHHFVDEEYPGSRLMKGAQKFLEWTKENGVPLALVTSSLCEWVKPLLRNLEVENYFQSIVTRDRVVRGKPYPDSYMLAMDELGISPLQSYAIEDAEAGLESAKCAGLKTLRYVSSPPYPPDGGDWPTLLAYFREVAKG
jgi:HAD superfamily hydrolase (TIGR01509 family)